MAIDQKLSQRANRLAEHYFPHCEKPLSQWLSMDHNHFNPQSTAELEFKLASRTLSY